MTARHAHPALASFRSVSVLFCFLLMGAAAQAGDKPRTPPPAAQATTYPLHDTHDGVTVAAEPGDSDETRPKTRLDYAHHGFMPIRVIVTNNGDGPLSLDDTRILFVAADNYTRNAATDDELERRMFTKKSATGTKIPLPLPIPSITLHHPGIDKQILADDTDFGFPTTTVPPKSTVSGYLFYDTRDIDDPVLEHATLELRRVRRMNSKEELQAFQIALKPTEKQASSAAEAKKTQP